MNTAAEALDSSVRTVRRRISDGSLKAYRVGPSQMIRIDMRDVESLLRPIPTSAAGRGDDD
jgi:excisionase family DNA binding protein